jgi:hypothetical protein
MDMSHTKARDVAIRGRIIEPGQPTLDPHAAKALLTLDFTD